MDEPGLGEIPSSNPRTKYYDDIMKSGAHKRVNLTHLGQNRMG